eukprot:SAG31_NODE_1579_length_7835_cov_6.779860_2_plen_91_part_00
MIVIGPTAVALLRVLAKFRSTSTKVRKYGPYVRAASPPPRRAPGPAVLVWMYATGMDVDTDGPHACAARDATRARCLFINKAQAESIDTC